MADDQQQLPQQNEISNTDAPPTISNNGDAAPVNNDEPISSNNNDSLVVPTATAADELAPNTIEVQLQPNDSAMQPPPPPPSPPTSLSAVAVLFSAELNTNYYDNNEDKFLVKQFTATWKYADLPQHVLVEIFSYLVVPVPNVYSIISPSVLSKPTQSPTLYEIAQPVDPIVHRGLPTAWQDYYVNLALVCKTWHLASSHDQLWNMQTSVLVTHFSTIENNKHQPPTDTYNYFNEPDSWDKPVNKTQVQIPKFKEKFVNNTTTGKPDPNCTAQKNKYLQILKAFQYEYKKQAKTRARQKKVYDLSVSVFKRRLHWSQCIITSIGYWAFVIFIVLCVLRERLNWTKYAYLPIYLALGCLPLGFVGVAYVSMLESCTLFWLLFEHFFGAKLCSNKFSSCYYYTY